MRRACRILARETKSRLRLRLRRIIAAFLVSDFSCIHPPVLRASVDLFNQDEDVPFLLLSLTNVSLPACNLTSFFG
jgi:hypothetical protein